MGNFKKMYVGAIDDEKEAALMYDKIAILTHGLKAKTNFDYKKVEINHFLKDEDSLEAISQELEFKPELNQLLSPE